MQRRWAHSRASLCVICMATPGIVRTQPERLLPAARELWLHGQRYPSFDTLKCWVNSLRLKWRVEGTHLRSPQWWRRWGGVRIGDEREGGLWVLVTCLALNLAYQMRYLIEPLQQQPMKYVPLIIPILQIKKFFSLSKILDSRIPQVHQESVW